MKCWIADRGADHRGARWRVVWVDPTTRRERSRSFPLKRDANEFKASLEHSLRTGTYLDPRDSERPFQEVADAWLDSKLNLRGSSRNIARQSLATWVLPTWGARPIGGIKREEVQRWVAQLAAGTAPRNASASGAQRPLSPASIAIQLKNLAGPLSFAVENDWLPRTPVRNIELPRRSTPRLAFLTPVQVERLAAAAAHSSGRDTDATLVLFLAFTGLRIGEALALRREPPSFDPGRRRVVVLQTWSQVGSRLELAPPKTGKAREVPVPAFLWPALEAPGANGTSEWLFAAPQGGPVNPHNWRQRVWRPAVRSLGLDPAIYTPHSLRHTAASMAINANANVKVVQQMLGHATATQTLDTYGHLWPDRLDEVAAAMEAARNRSMAEVSGTDLTVS